MPEQNESSQSEPKSLSDGAQAPMSFVQKLAFGVPIILTTAAASIAISYLLFHVSSQPIRQQVQEQEQKIRENDKLYQKRISETEETNTKLLETQQTVQKSIETIVEEKKAIKQTLEENSKGLSGAQEALKSLAKELNKLGDDQKGVDASQNTQIAEVSNRVTYIEGKLKTLDTLQADVMGLKSDTGNLKGQFLTLRKDLESVREKGDVTQKELEDLGERARRFQLRVLAARAQEAADAVRKNDLQKLLARLSEEE